MLTAHVVRTAQKPGTYWDKGQVSGFGLRVNRGGAKSFFLNYRFDGRECRHTIGAWPRWSVGAAREQAKELRKQIDRGINPAGEKRERREAPTIADLVDRYIADHLPRKSADPRRQKDERRVLALIGESLGKHTKVADIHGGDIAGMHRRITEGRGPVRQTAS